jgi:hypothetical protein
VETRPPPRVLSRRRPRRRQRTDSARTPQAVGAVRAELLGTVARDDGSTQVTCAGHPLYFYAHEGPGQVLCHDVVEFGGRWLAVTPEGTAAA